ncbi:hypothetical protein B296_00001055 [Ensete ventricosum]|uniref:Transposase (putative) gypsy type domain-containing protein n=1 Tax=Ensete ventricosum TaxID=4639 RepID=A0A427AYF0_ENSVE|nr:hypothetical protein B296_00001055 [Ensete ventricosum]
MCISVDALKADLWFPLHPLIEKCLKWWRISPSQVAPNSWRYLVVFLGEFRVAGIIPTRDLFMTCFRLCKNQSGYYLIARVSFWVSGAPFNNKGWKSRYLFVSGPVWGFRLDWSAHPIDNAPHQMNLGELRGMPKMSGGEAPSTRAVMPAREVGNSPARETPKASSKRPIDASTEQVDDPAQRPKKNDSSVAEEFERGLLHPQLARELCTLPSEVLLARAAKEMVLMALFDRVHDAGRLITFMDYRISNLQQQLNALKSGEGPEAVAKAEERASELEQERDEALQRLEASEKELTEVRSNLAEIQRLLKKAWVRARKMDDELLQSVKALESARAELPKQAVDRYKESADFKEGLKRMGRVTYEYGYPVALARFRALLPSPSIPRTIWCR